MFISKKHLSRRTVLQGAGVAVALPFLESMVPAQTPLAKTAAKPTAKAAVTAKASVKAKASPKKR